LDKLAQHGFELDAGDDAFAQRYLSPGDADFGTEEGLVVVRLAPHRKLRARRFFLEQQFRRDARHDLVHFGHRRARGVGGAHQRAHAGAGDAVDRHAVLFEDLEYPDVGRAARAAS
jgi:hypothetical protein